MQDSFRCENEIPQTSNPANCDATACNAPFDVMTEAGPRCASCFAAYGGIVVTEPEPEILPPVRLSTFGDAMTYALENWL